MSSPRTATVNGFSPATLPTSTIAGRIAGIVPSRSRTSCCISSWRRFRSLFSESFTYTMPSRTVPASPAPIVAKVLRTSRSLRSSARIASTRSRVSTREASGADLKLIWNSARSTGVKNSVLSGREREEAAEKRQRREGEHCLPVPEGPRDHRPIPVGRPVEPVVEPVEDPGDEMPLPRPVDVGIVPARREHRVEGERHEEGDEHGEGHGDPELEEEAPDDPLHERHRDEDGDDREGGGEHREPDLRGPGRGPPRNGPARARGAGRCSRGPRSRRRSGGRWRGRAPSASSR